MDLGTAIIGLILFALVVIPILVMRRNRLKKESGMMQALKDMAKQHSGDISRHEFCGDYVIGLDEKNKLVFFCKKTKETLFTQFVNLAEVQSCRVDKITKSIKRGEGNYEFTDRVNLDFLSKAANQLGVKFELFSEELNIQLSGELQMAEKWVKLINDLLQKKK